MEDVLPRFKYHPHPLQTKAIRKKSGVCPLCKRERDHFYTARYTFWDGPKNAPFEICPWCLSEGAGERFASCDFSSDCFFDGDVSSESALEVKYRTPGYWALQETIWLTHCHEPCAFLRYVDRKSLEELAVDVQADLEREARARNHSPKTVLSMLEENRIYQGYLFRCLKCGAYRLSVACD